ncbi:hypothetical protein RYX36_026294 [Vicia faba]
MNKLRNATDTFVRMKEYGFFPAIESCNAFMTSMLYLKRPELVLSFYRQMRKSLISHNVYTLNMVVSACCKLGELNKGYEILEKMKDMGLSPNVVTFNALISGYCNKGLLGLALKVKTLMMGNNGVLPNVVTFNTLINGFCKEGKMHEASRVFSEMKLANVVPNVVTYNTLINGFGQVGNSEMSVMPHKLPPSILLQSASTTIRSASDFNKFRHRPPLLPRLISQLPHSDVCLASSG